MCAVSPEKDGEVDEEEGTRDRPDQRGSSLYDKVYFVCQRRRIARCATYGTMKKMIAVRQNGHDTLEVNCVGRYTVFIEFADANWQALIIPAAGNGQEERTTVDNGDNDEETNDTQGSDTTEDCQPDFGPDAVSTVLINSAAGLATVAAAACSSTISSARVVKR